MPIPWFNPRHPGADFMGEPWPDSNSRAKSVFTKQEIDGGWGGKEVAGAWGRPRVLGSQLVVEQI